MPLNLLLYALLGFILADAGVNVLDKPLHFLFIMLIVVLIEHGHA